MRTRARVHFMKLYMCRMCVCACRPSGIQSRSEPQRLFASRTPSPTAIADVGERRRKKERQQEREKTFSHCVYLLASTVEESGLSTRVLSIDDASTEPG